MPGKVRGVVFETDRDCVRLKWGEEGLAKLNSAVKKYGLEKDLPYETVETMAWYPLGARIVSLLLIKEVFGLDDKGIRQLGEMAPKFSFIVKLLFKLFKPLQKLVQNVPRYWEEHYTVGKLVVEKVSEEDGEMILQLKDFSPHSILAIYLEGYFECTFRFLYPKANCRFSQKEDYLEYRFQW